MKALHLKAIRYSGSVDRIKKVAVCGGSGSILKKDAIAAGVQAFVTSDIKYHDYFLEKRILCYWMGIMKVSIQW